MSLNTRMRGRGSVRALTGLAVAGAFAGGSAVATDAAETQATDQAYSNVSVAVRHHVLSGRSGVARGYVKPGKKGRAVWIQARREGSGWHRVARAKTSSKGRFDVTWRPSSIGHYDVRLVIPTTGGTERASDGMTVYKASAASWYGPGFYGNRTACGNTLSRGTLGVANKSLPCGTKVRLYYHGNAVTAPVIDRGPYAGNREYDLTEETKNRLHFGSTGTVWSAPQS